MRTLPPPWSDAPGQWMLCALAETGPVYSSSAPELKVSCGSPACPTLATTRVPASLWDVWPFGIIRASGHGLTSPVLPTVQSYPLSHIISLSVTPPRLTSLESRKIKPLLRVFLVGTVTQVAECLPGKYEAPSSRFSTAKKENTLGLAEWLKQARGPELNL
jgi:hypothetical protein